MEKDIISLILKTLQSEPIIADSYEFASKNGVDHLSIVGGLKSLNSFHYVELFQLEKQKFVLTTEGTDYVTNGLYEIILHFIKYF